MLADFDWSCVDTAVDFAFTLPYHVGDAVLHRLLVLLHLRLLLVVLLARTYLGVIF
jgi:hypothetical protein